MAEEELDILAQEGFLETLAEEDPDTFLSIVEPMFVEDAELAEQLCTDLSEAFPDVGDMLDEELEPEEEDELNDAFIDEVMPELLAVPEVAEELSPIIREELGEIFAGEEPITLGWWRRMRHRVRRRAHRVRHKFRRLKKRVRRVVRKVRRRVRRRSRAAHRRVRRVIRRHKRRRARRTTRTKRRRRRIVRKIRRWIKRRHRGARRWIARRIRRRIKKRPKVKKKRPKVIGFPSTLRVGEEEAYDALREALEKPAVAKAYKAIGRRVPR